MQILKFIFPLSIALSLVACGDKDVTGKYVNTTDSNDLLTVTTSKDGKLYVLKGNGKLQAAVLQGALIPFSISTYKKDNSFYADKNDEKVATINNDEINLTLKKFGINNITYKKKEQ